MKTRRKKETGVTTAAVNSAVDLPDNKKETDPVQAAKSFRKITKGEPVRCEELGSNVFLHPIEWVDAIVIDARLQELFGKLQQAVPGNIAQHSFGKATMLLNVQASARRGNEKNAPLVYATVEDIEFDLNGKFEVLVKAFGLYSEHFELSIAEKKI